MSDTRSRNHRLANHNNVPANSTPHSSVCIQHGYAALEVDPPQNRCPRSQTPRQRGQGSGKLETVTLVGVEASGIWIESEEAANRIADRFRVKPATPSAFFIPFAQIVTILASNDSADATETGTVVIETAA